MASKVSGNVSRVVITSVHIDKRVLEGFRRRVKRAYPKEHLEAMLGQITTSGEVLVHAFCAVDHKGTRDSCTYDPSELLALEQEFAVKGLHVVGSFHSHPGLGTCVHPSDTDHSTGTAHGEFVMGIMHVFRQDGVLRTRCSFNVPRAPLKILVS